MPTEYAIPLAILLIIVTLFFVFNKQIVHALEPVGNDLRKCVFDCTLACIGLLGINVIVFIYVLARLKAGWLIPIAILFVLSFPPVSCSRVFFQTPFLTLNIAIWSRDSTHARRTGLWTRCSIWNSCCWHITRRIRKFLVRTLFLRNLYIVDKDV